MSSQNNMAKESLSLQNHIVRLCFIFVTQNTPIMHNPGMSMSHGYSTMGGIEYDDGGCVEKTKKEKVSY